MDLLRAARDVAKAAADVERRGVDVDWDDHRHVAGVSILREVENESASPLRDVVASWIAWLTVARVSQPAAMRAARAISDVRAIVHVERDEEVSLRQAIDGWMTSRSVGEARAYFTALPDFRASLEEPLRTHREFRTEAFHRLEIEDVAKRFMNVNAIDLVKHAREFILKTDDLARELVRKSEWPLAIDFRLAKNATEGWPSRLSWRTAAALLPGFRDRGVIKRNPPHALGGASFSRALRSIGYVFQPVSEPCAPPLFPEADRMGLVFASALAEKTFHARVLGLASGRAVDQSRVVGVSALLDARAIASRVAVRGGDAEELAVIPKLARTWPVITDDDFAKLLALLAFLPMRDALHAREGDDWFRNPRAFATLREMSAAPTEIAENAVKSLAERFEQVLA